MRIDASIFTFSAGALLGLGLLWVSTTAAVLAVGVGALVALVLVDERREK